MERLGERYLGHKDSSDRQSITVSKKGYLLGTANIKAQNCQKGDDFDAPLPEEILKTVNSYLRSDACYGGGF
ncbi:hypothetical protein, partial [Scytonema sp. PCC 10023]|uniref:hypothetical protein n=1 Tax=Scytonema sp. PCC 10023 TaxID=1680591 RepID=UPI0039C60461